MPSLLDPDMIDFSEELEVGAATDLFFSDGTPGVGETPASFARIHNRLFVGDGAAHTGASESGGDDPGGSWLQTVGAGTEHLDYFEDMARAAVVTSVGIAGTYAARNAGASSGASIGLAVLGMADNAAASGAVWGLYGENVRAVVNANVRSVGIEWNAVNVAGPSPLGGMTPYVSTGGEMINGVWLASGGDPAVNPTSYPVDSGITFANNGNTFLAGIVFRHDALQREGGTATNADAMRLAQRHTLSWWGQNAETSGNREQVARIWSEITEQAYGQDLVFADAGLLVKDRATGSPLARVEHIASAANYLTLGPNISGGAVKLKADGADTNIDLQLEPQGTLGRVKLSYGANPATVPASFAATHRLEIKDGTGTTYYIPAATAAW